MCFLTKKTLPMFDVLLYSAADSEKHIGEPLSNLSKINYEAFPLDAVPCEILEYHAVARNLEFDWKTHGEMRKEIINHEKEGMRMLPLEEVTKKIE